MEIINNNISQSCPLCQSRNLSRYLEVPDRFSPHGGLYYLYQCVSCSFIFLHPLPSESEMARFYAQGDYDPFMEVEGSKETITRKLYSGLRPWALSWKAKQIAKFLPQPGRLLDIGAGTGAFLHYLALKGWEVWGVEKDQTAADFGRKIWGLKVFNGDFSDFESAPADLNAITFWHSLEHIHRWHQNLTLAREHLISGGYIFIALPNPQALDAKIYKDKWVAWDAPRHLWHFKPQVLIEVLTRMGFNFLRITAMPLDPFYHSLLSEFLFRKGGWWRFPLRLPAVSLSAFILGNFEPEKASSILYIARKI